ncbi:MAG: hypothetical protein M3007_05355, partial [Candidatus Eremiobacteraeota bacterium]|nr:hypothetical protein [Candidatus Eremiobacteraeota bacterium]
LEVAWTKPASRTHYALTTIGVDLLAAWAAFGLALAAALAVIAIGKMLGWVYVDADAWQNLARFLLLPVAFTGLWQALTASMRSHAGNVIGFSVVGCVILLSLSLAPLPTFWHGLVDFLNFFNPMVYGTYVSGAPQHFYPFPNWQLDIIGLATIGIFGIGIALLQWRKLEA